MSALRALTQRLSEADAQQYLALYLAALVLALVATWPGGDSSQNDAWFGIAYTRAVGLSLLGLGYGISLARSAQQLKAGTLWALLAFAVLGWPLEMAAYAASYPATPLWWALLVPLPTVIAMFGVGLLLGRLLFALRLHGLSPMLVPLTLAGMVAVDVYLGVNLVNPVLAAVRVSLPHLGFLLLGTLLCLIALRPHRRERWAEA